MNQLRANLKESAFLWIGLMFFSACTAGKADLSTTDNSSTPLFPSTLAESTGKIDLSDSYAVREVEKLKNSWGDVKVKDPRSYYHYMMALRADEGFQFEQSAIHYTEAARYDPDNLFFHHQLTKQALRAGDFKVLETAVAEGLKHFPNNAELNMRQADVYRMKGETNLALDFYEKAYEADPGLNRAYILRGVLLEELNRFDRAQNMYQKAVLASPFDPLSSFYLGRADIKNGDYEDAVKNLEKSVSLRPNFIQARDYLAWALEKLGRLQEALNEYKLILKLDPGNIGVRQRVAKMHERTSVFKRNNPEIDLPVSNLLEPVHPNIKMGVVLYDRGDYLRALEEFQWARSLDESKEVLVILSKIFENLNRIDLAIKTFEELRIKSNPSVRSLLYLARLYNLGSQDGMAAKLLEEAVKLEPDNDRLYHSLALAYRSMKDYDRAIANMKEAIRINGKKDSYHFEFGALLERAGKFDEALGSMKRAIELNPMHSNAHNFLGYMYATQGEYLDKALVHLKKALAIQPHNGYFLDSMGWIYYKKGDYPRALTEIKKAMIYSQPDPVLYSHLGDVHFSLKNYLQAQKAWKTSLSLTAAQGLEGVEDDGETPDPKELSDKIEKVNHLLEKSL